MREVYAVAIVVATYCLAAFALFRMHAAWFPTVTASMFASWGVAYWILREHPAH
jgi:hypothetical protein